MNHSNYVYCLFCKDFSGRTFVKFGRTGDLAVRVSQIQVGCPFKIDYLGYVSVDTQNLAERIEKALHREFKYRRQSGEWFMFDFSSKHDKRAFRRGSRVVLVRHFPADRKTWWTKTTPKQLISRKDPLERYIKNYGKTPEPSQIDRDRAEYEKRKTKEILERVCVR